MITINAETKKPDLVSNKSADRMPRKRKRRQRPHENTALVTLAISGNVEAIEELIENCYPDILSFSIMRVGYLNGEDVAQQAALQIVSKIGTLKDPSKFRGWMLVIVSRCCTNFFRENGAKTMVVNSSDFLDEANIGNITDEGEINPEQTVINEETKALVLSVLSELPENFRSCLWLFYHEDMPRKQIAETLDVSVKKVENDLYSARLKFKQLFTQATKERKSFDLASGAALAVLIHTIQGESLYVPSPEALNLVLASTQDQIALAASGALAAGVGVGAGGAGGAVGATGGVGLAKTIALAATALVATAGIAVGAYVAINAEQEPQQTQNTEVSPQVNSGENTVQDAEVAAAQDKDIHSIADMIGENEALELETLKIQDFKQEELDAYTDRIGAKIEFSGTESDYQYRVYQVQKQDKQLLLYARSAVQDGSTTLIVQFGEISKIPFPIEVMNMFD